MATAEASPLGPGRLSPPLAVTGFLMLVTVFLLANPYFGVSDTAWPWETLVQARTSPLLKVVFFAWIITAFWCLLTAFTQARRTRAVVATGLGAILIVACSGEDAGFTIRDYNLMKMLPMIALGAGLLLAREPAVRGTGRAVAGLGAAFLVWSLATAFIGDGNTSRLQIYVEEMGLLFADFGHEFEEQPNHLWWTLIPQTLVFLSAICGLLAAAGVTGRRFLLAGFILLLLALLWPLGVGTVFRLQEGGGLRDAATEIVNSFVGHGLLLWMLGVFSTRDLGLLRAEAA